MRNLLLALFSLILPLQILAQDLLIKSYNQLQQLQNSKISDIEQSNDGFIWFIADAKVYRFDGLEVLGLNEIVALDASNLEQIIDIGFDHQNNLWMSTQEHGLFVYDGQQVATPKWQNTKRLEASNPVQQFLFDQNTTWLIRSTDLIKVEQDRIQSYPFPSNQQVDAAMFKNAVINQTQQIYVATKTQLLHFNSETNVFKAIDFKAGAENPYIWQAQVSQDNSLWLVTDDGAYRYNNIEWQKFKPQQLNMKIKSIQFTADSIWFATAFNGLAEYSFSADQLVIHQHQPRQQALLSNNLQQITTDNNGLLWLTYFEGNLSVFDPRQRSALEHAKCSTSPSYYGFAENHRYRFYLTIDAIVLVDKISGSCDQVITMERHTQKLNGFIASGVFIDSSDRVWVGTPHGLLELDPDNKFFVSTDFLLPSKTIQTLAEINPDQLLIGTIEGLYIFNKSEQTFTKFDANNPLSELMYYQHSQFENSHHFITNKGLVSLDQNGIKLAEEIMTLMGTQLMTDLAQNRDYLFIGTKSKGIFAYDLKHNTGQFLPLENSKTNNIANLALKPTGVLLMTNQQGITAYDIKSSTYKHLTERYGLKNSSFSSSSSYVGKEGAAYFGTADGFAKLPETNFHQQNPLFPLVITRIKRFNTDLLVNAENDGFNLPRSIEQLDEVQLSHRDYVMEFQFTYLDYLSPDGYDFAYQLKNFDPNWNTVNSSKRFASYTNLPAGNYELLLKLKQANGQWSDPLNSLSIKVSPAPWLSWWAFVIYAVMLLALVFGYVQWKIHSNIKLAKRLRLEVNQKTKELQAQKKTVESLLVKKNDLFSNVSHEFRTPLTLILGPIKELLHKQVDVADHKTLTMINRNANRLLSLVEQLLQIARVSDLSQVKTTPQNTEIQISSLIESFQHMAKGKKIQLELTHNDSATIDVTDQFIDAVLGNLVSNAIKYTQSGGLVTVKVTADSNTLCMSVKDTGKGLTSKQQKDIFKRFKRLDSHQSIEGIGIGLSVVEELVKVNHGVIQVNSVLDQGSEFVVKIPLADAVEDQQEAIISSLVTQLQKESVESVEPVANSSQQAASEDGSLNTVLVIEDNHDMREHIIEIVRPHYNILAAENGAKGVAKAIEQVPDIIISDVMMPEMDGFDVARVIRADQRTSHIPLMLLTALNDKTSRIKGWRENVDAYMTKPFDRDELLVQLENMLTIRDILKRKAGQSIVEEQSTENILPKKDQAFVDHLMQIIEENYDNPILNRAKIASKMAVSDRQLQRKLKALVDQNPMDILREFRLNKAKEKLKDGYQVSQISDECGFNSLSYFSQCFKAKFGVSPKKYQQQTNAQ